MNIEMKVAGITLDPETKMPIVILIDMKGESALPIWIGIAEANAIATRLDKIDLARPMTHDLMRNLLAELGARLEKVVVTELKENTFFSNLYLSVGEKTLSIDSRPSDAIALALRAESPIFVSEEVLQKANRIDLKKVDKEGGLTEGNRDKWAEILENLSPDAFGKYKM
jgi:uncharacterized protein